MQWVIYVRLYTLVTHLIQTPSPISSHVAFQCLFVFVHCARFITHCVHDVYPTHRFVDQFLTSEETTHPSPIQPIPLKMKTHPLYVCPSHSSRLI